MAHPETAAEQAHVDRAYARLDAMRRATEEAVHEAYGERGGTFQSLAERDIRVRNGLSRLEQLDIGNEALVFGRIDKQPPAGDGDRHGESFHIGRLAVSDVDQEPLVVDWRAPVAEPFYRATGAHPMGLRRRRHFLAQGRRVLDLDDELFDVAGAGDPRALGVAGSRALLAALERSRTGRMRDIVATVQREQDEIIRGPLPGVLVVQGGPGTGKTAVALHRAAYLLYTHRFPLERQGVLVVGPNPLFLRYISHVLPSLGETGVELSTVPGLFREVRRGGSEPPAVARLKGDARMARVVARAVANRQRPLRRTILVPYGRAQLRITPGLSADIVTMAKRRAGSHNVRRPLVETLLWRALHEQLTRRMGDAGSSEAPSPEELGRELRRVPEVSEALDRMWPLLRAPELLHDLFGAPPLIDLAARDLLDEDERRLLARPRSASVDDVAWTNADAALLDEARAVLGPSRRRAQAAEALPTYGHVVVDEAQDLSPMELRMLARRSLSGSMTVVGDVAQGTSAWAADSWEEVLRHLPRRRGSRRVELSVNYRTPTEIMAVAGAVLRAAAPGSQPPESVRASGERPRAVTGDIRAGDTVARVVREELDAVTAPETGEGTCGVITADSLLDAVVAALRDRQVPVGRGVAGGLDAPVTLVGIDEAKGLEFDSVVVVEPARLVREAAQGLRALYVALTRSTGRLVVVHDEPLPGVLAAALAAVPEPVSASSGSR